MWKGKCNHDLGGIYEPSKGITEVMCGACVQRECNANPSEQPVSIERQREINIIATRLRRATRS